MYICKDRAHGSARRQLSTGLVALLLAWTAAAEVLPESTAPGLGEPLAESEFVDFTVLPDGTGLPPGSGSVAAGEVLYQQHCAACHGARGTAGPDDALAGGIGSLTSGAPQKTVGSYWPFATTLFDYIRRAMPYQTPGSLSADELYAVTAYVLFLNGIVDGDASLSARTLPAVQMPNRHGFSWGWPPANDSAGAAAEVPGDG